MTRPTETILILFVAVATAARLLHQFRAGTSTRNPLPSSNKAL